MRLSLISSRQQSMYSDLNGGCNCGGGEESSYPIYTLWNVNLLECAKRDTERETIL